MVYNNLFILSFINLFEIELPSCIVCIVLISLGFYMFLSYLLFTFFFCRTVSLGLSIPASVSVNESDTVQIRCSVLGGETDVMFTWKLLGNVMDGETSNTITVNGFGPGINGNKYTCVGKTQNGFQGESNEAILIYNCKIL